MRILNEQDQEIEASSVDLDLGYLKPDKIFITRHEEILGEEEIWHYAVSCVYFEDGSFEKTRDNDERIKIIDKQVGIFEWIPQAEEDRVAKGMDLQKVIDKEAIAPKPAWDEYEDIQRYVLYTEEELEQRKQEKEEAEKRANFLTTGPDRLASTEVSIGDLSIAVSDIFMNMMSL